MQKHVLQRRYWDVKRKKKKTKRTERQAQVHACTGADREQEG